MSWFRTILMAGIFFLFLLMITIGDYFLSNLKPEQTVISEEETGIQSSIIEKIQMGLENSLDLNLALKTTSHSFFTGVFELNEKVEKRVYKNQNGENIVNIYSFPFSGHDISITMLHSTFQDQFLNDQSEIIAYNKYGDQSWVIRLAKDQKNMYLVVAHDDRLLGIEYLLGEDLSRHQALDAVLYPLFIQ